MIPRNFKVLRDRWPTLAEPGGTDGPKRMPTRLSFSSSSSFLHRTLKWKILDGHERYQAAH